jgi:multimeric flavodoxin WrbA
MKLENDAVEADTLIVNCSYRNNGSAVKLINSIRESDRFGYTHVINLPDVRACYDCEKKFCREGVDKCKLDGSDKVSHMLELMLSYTNIVFV